MRFHFLSYKFGRLILPWAILLIVGSTLALADSRWRNFLLVDELMLVALAVLRSIRSPRVSPETDLLAGANVRGDERGSAAGRAGVFRSAGDALAANPHAGAAVRVAILDL